MANFKSSESTAVATATAFAAMRLSLNEADMISQISHDKIVAASRSIGLMLREPDSGPMRMRIKALCDMIEGYSFDVMNSVNWNAEQHGVNFVDEEARAEESRIHAAAKEPGYA